jgi:hypothetical protein
MFKQQLGKCPSFSCLVFASSPHSNYAGRTPGGVVVFCAWLVVAAELVGGSFTPLHLCRNMKAACSDGSTQATVFCIPWQVCSVEYVTWFANGVDISDDAIEVRT